MEKKYNYLLNLIYDFQAQGRYTFSFEEIKLKFQIEEEALKKSLSRLSRKGKIVSVRKGFYVIVPPEYASQELMPPPLFIDALMQYIEKPYYVGLLSAAALHGAAHQQPQEFQVITAIPALRTINVKQNRIKFLTKREFNESGIESLKTDTGYIKLSGPELTMLDLIQFEQRIGGLNRVIAVVDELAEECSVENMNQLLSGRQIQLAPMQRLGYLLDNHLKQPELANAIYEKLKSKKYYRISLTVSKSNRSIRADNRWKVAENLDIESNL
jgi:predicted transcriptional regulator of viral defense system